MAVVVLLGFVRGLEGLCRDEVAVLGLGEPVELGLGFDGKGVGDPGVASGFLPGDCDERITDGLAVDTCGVSLVVVSGAVGVT
ncbi:hypothetical protein B0J18DRAFT_441327 [Chaetomium sp. MPI-SDFR-AT-0129]|nr:hypothetical protein B0J18DRAFT_441327 [Chaetomium sp. MPI-SDFR-AT-0129]